MTTNEALMISSAIPTVPAVLGWISAHRAHKEVKKLSMKVSKPRPPLLGPTEPLTKEQITEIKQRFSSRQKEGRDVGTY